MLNEPDEAVSETSGVRDRQRASTRRRLLNSALEEFITQGFTGASTRRITSAAGVSHGLMFHTFGSKAELYLELVRIGSAEIAADVRAGSTDPMGFFSQIAERMLLMLKEQPRTARMFVFMDYAAAHSGLVQEVDTIMADRDPVAQWALVVEAGQTRGQIRAGSAQALALVFWAALLGVAREAFSDPAVHLPEPDWLLDLLRRRSTL